jgi:hypothetical protein
VRNHHRGKQCTHHANNGPQNTTSQSSEGLHQALLQQLYHLAGKLGANPAFFVLEIDEGIFPV